MTDYVFFVMWEDDSGTKKRRRFEGGTHTGMLRRVAAFAVLKAETHGRATLVTEVRGVERSRIRMDRNSS